MGHYPSRQVLGWAGDWDGFSRPDFPRVGKGLGFGVRGRCYVRWDAGQELGCISDKGGRSHATHYPASENLVVEITIKLRYTYENLACRAHRRHRRVTSVKIIVKSFG